ncbi:MAG: LD-carboxypeptidase [Candidatus Aenigmarchaeota archaeon]|nr:LD-carboxypeptidase [Candidatus Aenigmarchaeota archaeon]
MIPQKLKEGDEIRVISPARSLAIISQEARDIALKKLMEMGFKITFSKHAEECDEFSSSSIGHRLEDIHEAFSDENVKGILTTIGGFNSNQLLKYLDYDLIKSNPKILCGYSDITALQNTIFKKVGLVTYSGPHFSTFGMLKGLDYTIEYFKKCVMEKSPFEVKPSEEWSDDEWYKNQEKREFIKNKGFLVINEGKAEGTIIGGNLCTLNLLQGTEFMPSLKNTVLFIEDDEESKPQHFDRDLQSLIHLPDFDGVKGIVIGRFQKASEMTERLLTKVIKTKKELNDIPVIAGVDFGHTTPHITFPIGGKARLLANKDKTKLEILEH